MSYSLDDPRLSAALDAWATRSPGDDCDEDLAELAAQIDADEAHEAALRAPCAGCGLPYGAHSDEALAGCGVLS